MLDINIFKAYIGTFARKLKENREVYEAILKRSRARFPDNVLPDIVDTDTRIDVHTLDTTESEHSSVNEDKISFEELHKRAIHRQFLSTDEMKFLILVDQLLCRRRSAWNKTYGNLSVTGSK